MLTLTPEKSFTKFKKDFYKTFSNLRIFDAGDFNVLKIVLDGLKVNYSLKYPRRTFIFYSFPLSFTLYLIQYVRYNFFTKKITFDEFNKKAVMLFIDFGKPIFINNIVYSYIYYNILKELNPNEYQLFSFYDNNKKNNHVNLNHFYFLKYNYNYFSYRRLRSAIKNVYSKLNKISSLSSRDKKNIKIALQNFYENVIFYDNIFSFFPNVKKVIINMHYHNEALIYSARKKNIRVLELQHGLISENDIFFVFPKTALNVRKKALFPDEIWVYGNFWKNKLLKGYEYEKDNIFVVGDIRFETPLHKFDDGPDLDEIKNFVSGNKCILITTQTFLHDEYIEYIRFLSDYIQFNKLNYRIIVKIHPNERLKEYESLKHLNHIYITKNASLKFLFQICNFHISIFSTTLYDALKYPNMVNFSLEPKIHDDYHHEIITHCIAIPLKRNEFPANVDVSKYSLRSPHELFSEMNIPLIKSRLAYEM